nr:T9SS type A sorting domain-containing protein [Bacteroidota bacterium]
MKYIFIISFAFLSLQLFAQNSFEKIFRDSSDQYVTSIIETEEYYILTTSSGTYSVDNYKTRLFKINKPGKVVLTKTLKPEVGEFITFGLIEKENNIFTGFGHQKYPNDSVVFFTIYETDDNFELLSEKTYRTNFQSLSYLNILKSDELYTIVGAGRNMNSYYMRLFAYKLDNSYDTLISQIYPEEGMTKTPFCIIPGHGEYNYKIFVRGFHQHTNTPGQILQLNSQLEINDIKGIPDGLALFNDAIIVNEDQYLLTGERHISNSHPQDEQLGVMLMNSNDSVVELKLLGAVDTIDYPGIYTNLDFIDINNIYFAGTKNFSIGGIFAPTPSWFFLNKLDSNLEIQWQKFYGGDAYYMLWNMIATQDGGCLMAGTRYDHLTQVNERDIYLVKVDENGLITGTGEELSQVQVYDAIVYPNPGSSYMKVQSGPQIEGAVFDLYDMAGKAVAREILYNRIAEINTSALPVGTYTYRIGLNNRLVGSGKWVKR